MSAVRIVTNAPMPIVSLMYWTKNKEIPRRIFIWPVCRFRLTIEFINVCVLNLNILWTTIRETMTTLFSGNGTQSFSLGGNLFLNTLK